MLTQDPSSTVVPVVEPPLFESPSGLIIDQRPPDPEAIILEEIFFTDANQYGFFGAKVTPELTARISIPDVVKIHGSGHYLLKGSSYNFYQQIKQDVGQQLLLTSGIRNVVKQMHLFLAKALQSKLNLSKASRSLAPTWEFFPLYW